MRSGCATLVALNKWDIGETDLDDATARLAQAPAPAPAGDHLLGAHRAATCRSCCERSIELADRRAARIPTPELNRFVADLVASRPPPPSAGRRLRLYYAAQVGRRPPRFAIQVNDRRLITRDWAFHLENRLREAYGLEGVPLVIDFVPHTQRRADPARAGDEVAVGAADSGDDPEPSVKRAAAADVLLAPATSPSTAAAKPPDAPREGGEPSPPGRPGFASIPDRLQDAWYAVEDAALAAGRLTVDIGRDLWELWFDLSINTRRRLGLGAGRAAGARCCCGCSRSRRFPARRLAGTRAHRPTTRSTWCPRTPWPTCT